MKPPTRALASLLLLVCIAAAPAVLAAPLSAGGQSGVADPLMKTKALIDEAVTVLRNPQLSLADERRELRDMAAADLDFDDMARSALGYHWKHLSAEERTQFVRLFTAFIEDAYLSKIQDYSDQQVQFIRETFDGQGSAEVYSNVVKSGDSPIALNFMLEQEGGNWKIYDVVVDGISITANYRNQFNRVINEQGFTSLMNEMQAKQRELASMLGKKR